MVTNFPLPPRSAYLALLSNRFGRSLRNLKGYVAVHAVVPDAVENGTGVLDRRGRVDFPALRRCVADRWNEHRPRLLCLTAPRLRNGTPADEAIAFADPTGGRVVEVRIRNAERLVSHVHPRTHPFAQRRPRRADRTPVALVMLTAGPPTARTP